MTASDVRLGDIAEDYTADLPPCEPGCDDIGPCEMREAMQWIGRKAASYPSGKFVGPLTPLTKSDAPSRIIAFTLKRTGKSGQPKSWAFEWNDGDDSGAMQTMEATSLATRIASVVLTSRRAGILAFTSGHTRHVLETLLRVCGPSWVESGYSLLPCLAGGRIIFLRVTRGHRSWLLGYVEVASGCSLDTLRGYAKDAGKYPGRKSTGAHRLYSAIDALQQFLLSKFGTALKPTAGMIALRCARRFLPEDFQKWRPTPLMVAMERDGCGYRGGIAFATKYHGGSWRVDVNRQYTQALTTPLPLQVAWGRYQDDFRPGVFLCRVQLSNRVAYPLGIWGGRDRGFRITNAGRGSYVCILHTSEFPGLYSAGAEIYPYYGYTYTRTFTFQAYVERIQAVITASGGKDTPEAKLTKPLGNFLYGKLGQRPEYRELLYSTTPPDKSWYPYFDDNHNAHENIYERDVMNYSMSQHVDVAATISGAARSQTVSMWAYFQMCGLDVIRCHTDSLTVSGDPSPYLQLDNDEIGRWHSEGNCEDTIVIGPNAFADQDGAHIAGVTDPTRGMVERLYAGESVSYVQQENSPLSGWTAGRRTVKKQLSGA